MGNVREPSLPRRPASAAAGAAIALAAFAGAALLIASAAIHLDLYLTGYRTIPVIGWMFLLQVIAGFALAAGVLATLRRVDSLAAQAAALGGALFALATLGGYLLSLRFGLFGFREVQTTAGIVAGLIEIAAFVCLAFVVLPLFSLGRLRAFRPMALRGAGAVAVIAVALLAADFATAPGGGTASSAGGQVLHTGSVKGVSVLTDSHGKTLYWFAPDTTHSSACYGECVAYWPPVYGTPTAGPGVSGKLGTITRTDGKLQATYNGRPLYTYVGDSGPGQASGNDIDINGGYWYEVKP